MSQTKTKVTAVENSLVSIDNNRAMLIAASVAFVCYSAYGGYCVADKKVKGKKVLMSGNQERFDEVSTPVLVSGVVASLVAAVYIVMEGRA